MTLLRLGRTRIESNTMPEGTERVGGGEWIPSSSQTEKDWLKKKGKEKVKLVAESK